MTGSIPPTVGPVASPGRAVESAREAEGERAATRSR